MCYLETIDAAQCMKRKQSHQAEISTSFCLSVHQKKVGTPHFLAYLIQHNNIKEAQMFELVNEASTAHRVYHHGEHLFWMVRRTCFSSFEKVSLLKQFVCYIFIGCFLRALLNGSGNTQAMVGSGSNFQCIMPNNSPSFI